jgi:hypothetical protein
VRASGAVFVHTARAAREFHLRRADQWQQRQRQWQWECEPCQFERDRVDVLRQQFADHDPLADLHRRLGGRAGNCHHEGREHGGGTRKRG